MATTYDELEQELAAATAGQTVTVDTPEMDLPDASLHVPEGVTLNGNGVTFHTTPNSMEPLTANGTVTNVTLSGEQDPYVTTANRYDSDNAGGRGIILRDGGTIKHSTIERYSDGGITIYGGNATVKNCTVRECEVDGLGYGVRCNYDGDYDARPVIKDSTLHTCRHEIMSSAGDSGYIVRNCVIGKDNFTRETGSLNQQDLDQHGGDDALHTVENCTFKETSAEAIGWDATHEDSVVRNCWFHHESPQAAFEADRGETRTNNHYGTSKPTSANIGASTGMQVAGIDPVGSVAIGALAVFLWSRGR